MTDTVSKETRSRMMASIRSCNTSPELIIRSALHALGFRFRVNARNLPGSPDIVLRKYNAAIFVHGCFWHGHHCSIYKAPSSRSEYWIEKVRKNKLRDRRASRELHALGWRTRVVRECAIRKASRSRNLSGLINRLSAWIKSGINLRSIKL